MPLQIGESLWQTQAGAHLFIYWCWHKSFRMHGNHCFSIISFYRTSLGLLGLRKQKQPTTSKPYEAGEGNSVLGPQSGQKKKMSRGSIMCPTVYLGNFEWGTVYIFSATKWTTKTGYRPFCLWMNHCSPVSSKLSWSQARLGKPVTHPALSNEPSPGGCTLELVWFKTNHWSV